MTTGPWLLVWAAVLVLAYLAAVGRCRDLLADARGRGRLRAHAARQVELVRIPWEQATARVEAALAPLLAEQASTAAGGFGDLLVTEERIAVAMAAIDPPRPDLGPEDTP